VWWCRACAAGNTPLWYAAAAPGGSAALDMVCTATGVGADTAEAEPEAGAGEGVAAAAAVEAEEPVAPGVLGGRAMVPVTIVTPSAVAA
jgi:hypothetical protein